MSDTTESTEVEIDLSNMKCPSCGHANDSLAAVDPDGPTAPKIGDATICFECGGLAIVEQDHLRACTEEEDAELSARPDLRKCRMMIAVKGLAEIIGNAHTNTDLQVRAVGIEVSVDEDGMPRIIRATEELPPDLRASVEEQLMETAVEDRATEIYRFVTQEVANHVLALYGDRDASWPKSSVSALIGLIRECHHSDEEILHHLNHEPMFHGYVLGVQMAETGDPGIEMLRKLGGLDPFKDGVYRPADVPAEMQEA